MDAYGKSAKCLFTLFNLVYFYGTTFVLGTSVFWLSGYFIVNHPFRYIPNTSFSVTTLTWALFAAVGGIILYNGLLGFLGACKFDVFSFRAYTFFIAFTILFEVAIIIVLLVYLDEAVKSTGIRFVNSFKNRTFVEIDDQVIVKLTGHGSHVSYTQETLKCCGINGMDDYSTTKYPDDVKDLDSVPYKDFLWSCCALNDTDFSLLVADGGLYEYMDKVVNKEKCLAMETGYFYSQGCKQLAEEKQAARIILVVTVLAGFVFIHVLGLILACYICTKRKENCCQYNDS